MDICANTGTSKNLYIQKSRWSISTAGQENKTHLRKTRLREMDTHRECNYIEPYEQEVEPNGKPWH